MKKHSRAQKQVDLFAPTMRTIPIAINLDHPMVRLNGFLDWDSILEVVERIQSTKIQSNAGARPHLRANAGAVVVRAMKSCDLRTTSDLIQNYLPARYLCDLHESQWTPDFRTFSDFEIMLGDQGLSEINTLVLRAAKANRFLDVRGLCSDTTAQEAKIPYPNEVGLMRSFADSVRRGVSVIGRGVKQGSKKIVETVKTIKKLVRKHRLFAKTKEAKREIEKNLSELTKILSQQLQKALLETSSNLSGKKARAKKRLMELDEVMLRLLPQIDHYIQKGKVAKDKIISLFFERCSFDSARQGWEGSRVWDEVGNQSDSRWLYFFISNGRQEWRSGLCSRRNSSASRYFWSEPKGFWVRSRRLERRAFKRDEEYGSEKSCGCTQRKSEMESEQKVSRAHGQRAGPSRR